MFKKAIPVIVLTTVMILSGCSTNAGSPAVDKLAELSDEFNDSTSLAQWKKAGDTFQNGFYLSRADSNQTSEGHLFLEPTSGTWYGVNTGHLSYKTITGDFVATMRVKVTGKSASVPSGEFDMAGLMMRAPGEPEGTVVPDNKENWEYLTTGGKNGTRLIDFKQNVNSQFIYKTENVQTEWIELKLARIGSNVVKLYKEEGGQWKFADAHERTDLPTKLQVGYCLLTNLSGYADNLTYVDYIRFNEPKPSKDLAKKLESKTVEEQDWLELLGTEKVK
ncbi:hypothetical protein [Paenibacillus sp. FJAT-26967]|uniref:hypothetical protein n=1 Tax=Paenibacillus sp. FJAT-26967 TaxID=1729690 RepID=UPI000837E791|nr:hypothetical protein [Paenibacillus sp. FJAT-26967]